MTTERIDVLAVTLPEPVGYRWILDTGEVRFNDDANYPPCDAYEEWSVCAAMFDADQVRAVASEEVEKVRAAVAELIEAANAIIPKGDAVWRGAGDFEHATFGVFRKDWERFTAAITKAGEK